MSRSESASDVEPTDENEAHTLTVRSVEAARWTSLNGKLSPKQRRDTLRAVAAKMR